MIDVESYPIVSADMTVKAMRDSGYKSTAHAIAELIDNGIEAQGDVVELFAVEATKRPTERSRYPIAKIAVMDNGTGMDRETLRKSLRFGVGSRQERKGIGRFGVGLPNSSMSQCTRVDVWSWQNGPENALHTYLDLHRIEGTDAQVPEPVQNPVPQEWQKLSQGLGASGTLVLWTDLDRVQWIGTDATLKHTEWLIGRIYRRYITDGRCRIRLVPVHGWDELPGAADALPNDPLYLTPRSSAPAPFDVKPMFQPIGAGSTGEIGVEQFMVKGVDGKTYPVKVRASIARDAARRSDIEEEPWPDDVTPTLDPGRTSWGKHAARNLGISLMRADRELDLDNGWTSTYDPVERWWGIEIDFPPQLDEIFGVTNNKQSATKFTALSHFDWTEEGEGLTQLEFKELLKEEGDGRVPLMEIVFHVRDKLLKLLRDELKQQTRGTRKARSRHESAEKQAEQAVRRRREEAGPSETDLLENQKTVEESRREQIDDLVKQYDYTPRDAERIVAETMAQNRHVRLITSHAPDSPAFFNIKYYGGVLQVSLNMDHPVYDDLVEVLDDEYQEDSSPSELKDRLERASSAFKLLLFSWARFEDETTKPITKDRIKSFRQDWGRMAREFFTVDEEDDE
ncbi:DNA mismatch repair protein [Streptomyces corynorhini]|uniref:DNA mismatch repair protein n=2 Tax=Streptomyces corynorhini TaxID=2282652 RepID=A0A370B868_9ACTN|nr:DNA mismatch repair protein [Streptomyces corynorhini]